MAMINYTNKVPLNANGGVADINKCNAIDLNEIKNAFNIQVAQGWYNIGVTALLTLTYVSFNSTTKIGVIASNLDLTPYLSVGMKFKFTQNSATKYGIITAISSTQITLFMGNNFTLNNSGISNPFYSMVENPYGFNRSNFPEQNTVMAYLTGGFTINNTIRKIPLNNSYVVGNKLKFENNAITVVGDDVSFVEVSVAVNGQASSTLNNVQLIAMIYKNNDQITTGYDFKQTLNQYFFANAIVSKILIPVVKNDVISLYTQVSENQTLQIVNEFKFGTAYLTVDAKY